MPVPPGSKLFKNVRKGRIKIFETGLTQEDVVSFYKGHYKDKDATFFKKRGTDVIMVAGNLTRVIEVTTRKNKTFISYSKFDL